MELSSINQFLLLASWFALSGLIFILALIARFYENMSSRKTHYQWFAVPIVIMGVSVARYTSTSRWGGDWLADIFAAISGVVLVGLCYHLYILMTMRRK
jgi:hypothetical protein